jgi:hypothetical protein
MIYARLRLEYISSYSLVCLMNKRSSLDTEVKQQHMLVEFKAGYSNGSCCPFYSAFESAIQRHNFEI